MHTALLTFDGLYSRCTFIYLLSQHDVYTAFDFNNHVLSVQRADRKASHLSFGFGQYGAVLAGSPGENHPAQVAAASVAAKSPIEGNTLSLSPAAASIATGAAGIRPDIAQYLETAAFYQNVNEEVFACLKGMEAVA